MGAAVVDAPFHDPVTAQLRRLLGLRFVPESLDGHREVLAGIAPEDLASAVAMALRECESFPTPSQLHEFVLRARYSRSIGTPPTATERAIDPVAVPIPHTDRVVTVTREYEHECDLCDDTGWRPCWCGPRDALPGILALRGAQFADCGRRPRDHQAHDFVTACACRPYNRTYQRKQELQAASARKRTEKAT